MGTPRRETPRSLPNRKFWFDARDVERICMYVKPKMLSAMRRMGILLPYEPKGEAPRVAHVQFYLAPLLVKIPMPKNRRDAERFLSKADRDLARVGFDDKFREAYRKTSELHFEKHFIAETTRVEGALLDEFVSVLDGVHGPLLWSILITDPETGEEDEAARATIENRFAACKASAESFHITHRTKCRVITGVLSGNLNASEGRLRTRRARKG